MPRLPRHTVVAILLAVLCAPPAAARAQTATGDAAGQTTEPPMTRQEILQRQREQKRRELTPYVVSDAEDRVGRLETFRLPRRIFAKGFGGFRPVVGGMPSGSGFVYGGGYIAGYNHELIQFQANARYSTRGYTSVDTGVIFPTPASRLPVQAHVKAEARDLTSLRFFGLGPESSASGRSTYGLEDRSIEVGVTATASRFAEMGATARWMSAEVGPGAAGVSLEDRFDPFQTPGFGTKTDYLVYGGHLVLHLRDAHVIPSPECRSASTRRATTIGTAISMISPASSGTCRRRSHWGTGIESWRSGYAARTRWARMAARSRST